MGYQRQWCYIKRSEKPAGCLEGSDRYGKLEKNHHPSAGGIYASYVTPSCRFTKHRDIWEKIWGDQGKRQSIQWCRKHEVGIQLWSILRFCSPTINPETLTSSTQPQTIFRRNSTNTRHMATARLLTRGFGQHVLLCGLSNCVCWSLSSQISQVYGVPDCHWSIRCPLGLTITMSPCHHVPLTSPDLGLMFAATIVAPNHTLPHYHTTTPPRLCSRTFKCLAHLGHLHRIDR